MDFTTNFDWEGNLTDASNRWSAAAKFEQKWIVEAEESLLGELFDLIHPIYWQYVHRECLELDGMYQKYNDQKLGLIFLAIAVVFEFLYLPVVLVMLKPEFIQHSCYKIMLAMGVIDLVTLIVNGTQAIVFGYFLLVGGSICSYPLTNVWLGIWALALWYGYSALSVLLGLNRVLQFSTPKLAEQLFDKHRIYFWLGIPIFYMVMTLLKRTRVNSTQS
ncbi:unnamed protein product, partial [Mesorhabditis spiculigera]